MMAEFRFDIFGWFQFKKFCISNACNPFSSRIAYTMSLVCVFEVIVAYCNRVIKYHCIVCHQ